MKPNIFGFINVTFYRLISPLQSSECKTKGAVKSRAESEESVWPQSNQDKERNPPEVVESVEGE